MVYGNRAFAELRRALCDSCYVKHFEWDEDTFLCWIRYINGIDREDLIKNTRFNSYVSLKSHFRKHSCYSKIARIRKQWFRPIKGFLNKPIKEHPWLLGLFYADGYIRNKSQLSFALSMHESLIEDRAFLLLKDITSPNTHIVKEFVGNMRQIRLHSTEVCDGFPIKKDKIFFLRLWNTFNEEQKLHFIAGFIDGDGSCCFDVGINSIQLYSKNIPFIIKSFYEFLSRKGYISILDNGCKLYISPNVGLLLKPYLVKKDIKRVYNGNVDIKKAFELLEQGKSVYNIARVLGFSKKTVHSALKQVYGIEKIKMYTDKTKRQGRAKYFDKDLSFYYSLFKNERNLYKICKKYNLHHTHLKHLLFKKYGKEEIGKYIFP